MAASKGAGAGAGADEADLKYKDRISNHASPIQLFAVDGCGGFVTEAEKGTPEALFCAGCGCHVNAHKMVKVPQPPPPPPPSPPRSRRRHLLSKGRTAIRRPISSPPPPPPPPPPQPCNDGSGEEEEEAAADEEEEKRKKKKPKSKFTEEQRDRMREFAEKLNWKPMRSDQEAFESFCGKIGIEPPVYKIWINNNRRRFLSESGSGGETSSARKKK